jgi:hypothetical protein
MLNFGENLGKDQDIAHNLKKNTISHIYVITKKKVATIKWRNLG